MKKLLATTACLFVLTLSAQNTPSVSIASDGDFIINKNIYGQFAEHLGTCIYGGLWVGEDSPIPNTNGYRNDVLEVLKKLKIPVLRWPGGCFADKYHWRDGIGPKENRPQLINSTWGGTMEDNSFGTHEFLNLCEILGCEPYVSMNVGSGTVQETAEWVEYMTADSGPMADLRKKNGREKPWKVKYIGVGNESWGCGGNMRPEYYSDLYRRYATYCCNYSGNRLFKIASGASDYDYNWSEVLMKQIGRQMDGLSLHYYTVLGWNGSKGSALHFTDDDYYWCLGKCLGVEEVIQKHIAIMDKYDARKRIALMLDEWGTWWDEEPGSIPGHLYQQNTMRDAFVAALSLNVFHKYGDRLKMANIAQIANVLQSMILTKEDKMVLTPTYFVFEMYQPHQDATYLPVTVTCESKQVKNERDRNNNRTLPMLSVTASKDAQGVVHVSLSNVDLQNKQEVSVDLNGMNVKEATGTILVSENITDYNSFEKPNVVALQEFKGCKVKNGKLTVVLPPASIVTIAVK